MWKGVQMNENEEERTLDFFFNFTYSSVISRRLLVIVETKYNSKKIIKYTHIIYMCIFNSLSKMKFVFNHLNIFT